MRSDGQRIRCRLNPCSTAAVSDMCRYRAEQAGGASADRVHAAANGFDQRFRKQGRKYRKKTDPDGRTGGAREYVGGNSCKSIPQEVNSKSYYHVSRRIRGVLQVAHATINIPNPNHHLQFTPSPRQHPTPRSRTLRRFWGLIFREGFRRASYMVFEYLLTILGCRSAPP